MIIHNIDHICIKTSSHLSVAICCENKVEVQQISKFSYFLQRSNTTVELRFSAWAKRASTRTSHLSFFLIREKKPFPKNYLFCHIYYYLGTYLPTYSAQWEMNVKWLIRLKHENTFLIKPIKRLSQQFCTAMSEWVNEDKHYIEHL